MVVGVLKKNHVGEKIKWKTKYPITLKHKRFLCEKTLKRKNHDCRDNKENYHYVVEFITTKLNILSLNPSPSYTQFLTFIGLSQVIFTLRITSQVSYL